MIYLIDPTDVIAPPCRPYTCTIKGCSTFCGIKPLYGIFPTE